MSAFDDAMLHVTSEWQDAAVIFRRVGCWSYTTIRQALDRAFRRGLVERRDTPIPSGIKHEYRR